MPEQLPLAEAYTQVYAAAKDRLVDQIGDGGDLAEVTAVVTGDRDRVRPDPPYLWLLCDELRNVEQRSLHELWDATLTVSGWLTSDDPDQGYLAANSLVMRARSVLLADRTLGLAFVDDVTSKDVFPSGPDLNKGTSFVAVARLDVRFAILEP